MTTLVFLIPIALSLGFIGLLAFIWSLKTGQFDDLDGAAVRILLDDDLTKHSAPTDYSSDDKSSEKENS